MSISTREHLSDALLARLPAGADVWLDPGTAVMCCESDGPHLLLPPPDGMRFSTPESDICYALDGREQHLRFGMARLGVYTVADYPNDTFWMGAHGEFGVTYAHVIGLEKLIHNTRPERLTLKECYAMLEQPLRQALSDAITDINGSPQWEYERICGQIHDLSQACWDRFFCVFFEHGLLLLSNQFQIEGIVRPTIT